MTTLQISENEYAPFYKNYIKALGFANLFEILVSSKEDLLKTLQNISEEKQLYQYDEDKWTIKELVQHIIDAERVLSYRALRFSRNDATDLQAFDEDWYVENSNGNQRDFTELLTEFEQVRNSNISLFKSFTEEMFTLSGSINGSDMTVRALGFIIAGHQIHHLKIIKEKYL
ncbi:DinB family protein [Lutibacter sp. HS1-25]|uniref:DinB family protein n=1 Tax=Lutibacter sp. HS1-25 TaxID=2485000 RepID=UPI001011D43A|nr:DinB family protein [Lutibacter sp. HS1-25]RXP56608.1 DinB family protein [Lutibacter sp. HS1-25]